MQINISNLGFRSSEYIEYRNVPKEFQASENTLSQIAKDHNITLKISKCKETKYLPANDLYTVFACKEDKALQQTFWGTGVFLSRKKDSVKSVIEGINAASQSAIYKTMEKFTGTNSAVSSNPVEVKSGFGKKISGLFKKILKK